MAYLILTVVLIIALCVTCGFGCTSFIFMLNDRKMYSIFRQMNMDKYQESRIIGKLLLSLFYIFLILIETIFDVFLGVPCLAIYALVIYATNKKYSLGECFKMAFGLCELE